MATKLTLSLDPDLFTGVNRYVDHREFIDHRNSRCVIKGCGMGGYEWDTDLGAEVGWFAVEDAFDGGAVERVHGRLSENFRT